MDIMTGENCRQFRLLKCTSLIGQVCSSSREGGRWCGQKGGSIFDDLFICPPNTIFRFISLVVYTLFLGDFSCEGGGTLPQYSYNHFLY